MQRRNLPLLALLLGLTLSAGAATPGTAPITVEADQLEMDQQSGVSLYLGNVLLQQQGLELKADRLELHSQDGRLQAAYADGSPVEMQQQESDNGQLIRARALHMEYHFADGTIEFQGDAQLWRGGDQFSGEHLIYDSQARTVKAFGDAQRNEEGRVRVILQPATAGDDNE
ncbi:MAG: lipopolysaccharide transport periplasmic protein LptA [Pseudomonadota bacterium]